MFFLQFIVDPLYGLTSLMSIYTAICFTFSTPNIMQMCVLLTVQCKCSVEHINEEAQSIY